MKKKADGTYDWRPRPDNWEHPDDVRSRTEAELWAMSDAGRALVKEAMPFLPSLLTTFGDDQAKKALEEMREWFWSQPSKLSDAQKALRTRSQPLHTEASK